MPVYTITDTKTGHTLDVRGSRPPTQQEAEELFASDQVQTQPPSRTWTDTAVNALPMVGGALGGLAGGKRSPMGMAAAGLGGIAGEGYRQTAEAMRGNFQNVPETVGGRVGAMATAGVEQAGLEGAGRAIAEAVTPMAKAVYRGYLKPSLSKLNLAKATQIVNTAFEEMLPVSAGGASEARSRIGALKTQVDAMLANTPGHIDLHEIADRVRSWAQRIYNRPGRAPADFEAAMQVANRIDQHPSLVSPGTVNPAPIPPVDLPVANQVKRDLQASVGERFGQAGSRATTATEKYGSFELRKAVEGAAPDVGALNMRESKLIDLARSLERATGREANRNALFGMPSLMASVAGGEAFALSHSPAITAATALATRIGLHPAVATRAALLAAKLAKMVPGTAVADVARAAVQATIERQHDESATPPQ